MRTCHTMFHSASVTPLSIDTSGSRSSSSSGTRHQSGPAGPMTMPTSTARTRTATPIASHGGPRRRAARTADAGARVRALSATARRHLGLLDGVRDDLGVLDHPRAPTRRDVVVHLEHV